MIDDFEERERRRRIIDESRALVRRLECGDDRRRREEKPANVYRSEPIESRRDRWFREAAQAERAREEADRELAAATARLREQASEPLDWSTFDARVEQHLVREREIMARAFGEETARLLSDLRQELMRVLMQRNAELETRLAQLASQLAGIRERIADEKIRAAVVADVLLPPVKNVN